MAKTAFAVAAHPDDIEMVMAGTLLLLADRGFEIHYLNVANGSMGTQTHSREEIIEIRRAEARSAARSIGAVYHESLVDDLDIFYRSETTRQLCAIMREVAPDILLVQSPCDYMEDHQNAVRLAVTAAFCRGMRNMNSIPSRPPIEKEVTVYHAQPHGNRDPLRQLVRAGIYVDISGVVAQKREMLACHESQKSWLDVSQGMDSYLTTMEDLSRETGELSGRYRYAEGWRRRNHLGFCGPDADPLSEALGDVSHIDEKYERALDRPE